MPRSPAALAAVSLLATVALPGSVALAGKKGHKSARSTGIAVQNLRAESVQVYIDGELAGMLPSGGRAAFPAREGAHALRLKDADGDVILSRRVMVEDGERSRVRLQAGDATLQLVNDTDVPQVVVVTDRSGALQRQSLAAGAALELSVTPGEVELKTQRVWFGVRIGLSEQDLRLEPGAVETVALPEVERALVQVDNRSEEPIVLYAGEDRLGSVQAETVGYVMAPVGMNEVVVTMDGMEAYERRVSVDAELGGRVAVEVRLGTVLVANQSPVAARLTVDGRPLGWMGPGEQRAVEVPVGMRTLAFSNGRGEVMDEEELRVSPREEARFSLRFRSRHLNDDARAAAWDHHDDSPRAAPRQPRKRRHHERDD